MTNNGPNNDQASKSHISEVGVWLFYCAVTVTLCVMYWDTVDDRPPASVENVIAGVADAPFQHRVLVPWYWREKPVFLRRAAWIFPVFAAGMLMVGHIEEARIWYEVFPLVLALALGTIFRPSRSGHNVEH